MISHDPLLQSVLFSPTLGPWQPLICFLITIVLPFLEFKIFMGSYSVVFCVWILTQHDALEIHLCCCTVPFHCWVVFYYVTICLSIHHLVDIWIIFVFWLLWIELLWSFVYRYYRYVFISVNYMVNVSALFFTQNTLTSNVWFPHTDSQLWHQLSVL